MTVVYLVWKIPDEPIPEEQVQGYHSRGIYPSGELMAICETEAGASDWIETLESGSPSGRFGTHEDGHLNDMSEAPYRFTVSTHEIDDRIDEYDETGAVE